MRFQRLLELALVVVHIADVAEIIGLAQRITNLCVDGQGCLVRFQRLLELALVAVYNADVAAKNSFKLFVSFEPSGVQK